MAAPVQAVETAGDHAQVFPPFDAQYFVPQLFWLAIAFGLLYLVLSRFLLPRLSQIIEERRDRIADDLDEAGRLNEEAKAAAKAYENALADARAKAHNIAADARAKIEAEVAEENARAEAEIDGKNKEAAARIRESKAAAMSNVRSIATTATVAMVEKLIGKVPSEAEAEKAAETAAG